ncbi:hypothetical protein NOG12_12810 [Pseudidiomarina sp. GXY010]|uniref:Uncharacterized protein n=2 Tax=Pseudidiomarina TaxID=2800384 RepID=A0AB39XE93_9GAMM|nr:hypothetical protein [Pseudidiomarina sp. GXY010]MDT7526952.1 hypothetical protein [Pseudidiomarina sp. GXY010]
MQLSIKDFRNIEVDGELVLLSSMDQVNAIAAGALIEAKPVVRNAEIITWKEFISGIEPPVFLGLHCGFPLRGGWWPIYLLQQEQSYIRVHLERIVCESCGWSGRSANPVVGQLYDGSADPVYARQRGFALPTIKCQKCSSKLPRPSVWVEG